MVAFKGRDRYDDDYTYDDSINDEYDEYDEYDEEERDMSLSGDIIKGVSSLFKNVKASWGERSEKKANKKAEYDDGDEDYEYDDEEYDDEDENADYKAKKKSRFRDIMSKKRKRDDEENYYEDEDGEEYMEKAPKKSRQRDSRGYSKEDYEKFDKIYGTRGSYERAEQAERNRAKVFGSRKPKDEPPQKKGGSNVTNMFGDKAYKLNVNGVYKFTPKNINDTNDIADYLMNAYAALIDLRGMTRNDILRILDFIDGVAYVLDYSFDELSKEMYMCAPKGFLKNFGASRYNNND